MFIDVNASESDCHVHDHNSCKKEETTILTLVAMRDNVMNRANIQVLTKIS